MAGQDGVCQGGWRRRVRTGRSEPVGVGWGAVCEVERSATG